MAPQDLTSPIVLDWEFFFFGHELDWEFEHMRNETTDLYFASSHDLSNQTAKYNTKKKGLGDESPTHWSFFINSAKKIQNENLMRVFKSMATAPVWMCTYW